MKPINPNWVNSKWILKHGVVVPAYGIEYQHALRTVEGMHLDKIEGVVAYSASVSDRIYIQVMIKPGYEYLAEKIPDEMDGLGVYYAVGKVELQ
jgi:hypothetical protein